MSNVAKLVEQHLNRCRLSYRKGEELKSLMSLAEALTLMLKHTIHSVDMQRIGNLLRENVGNVAGLEAVKRLHAKPLAWTRGQEKQLLAAIVPIIKTIQGEADNEAMEAMRERKLKLDRALLAGTRHLERGMIQEAQQSFREAVDLHVDENALFMMIAERLQAANFHSESFEYLRRALEIDPDGRRACEMLCDAAIKTKDLKRGLEYFQREQKKGGDTPNMLFGMARLFAAGKRFDQAVTLSRRALELDPTNVTIRKFLRGVEEKAGAAA